MLSFAQTHRVHFQGGYYRYSTSPLIAGKEDKLGNSMISGSMKVVRAMTQQECGDLLTSHGMKPQEWEGGTLDLSRLGVTEGEQDESARKIVAPITYDEDGKVILLSMRFNAKTPGVLYQRVSAQAERKPAGTQPKSAERKLQEEADDKKPAEASPKLAEEKLKEEVADWAKRIDALEGIPEESMLMLRQTPLVMHLIGADFRELYATPHFFERVFTGKDWGEKTLTKAEMKQIPAALSDPIAVFKQDNGRPLFLLDVHVPSGANIVVPVSFSAEKGHAAINLAITAVPKQARNKRPLYGWLKRFAGKELYVNTEKFPALIKKVGDEELKEAFGLGEEEPRAISGDNYPLRQDHDSSEKVYTEADLNAAREESPELYQKPTPAETQQAAEDAATLESSIIRGAYDPSKNRIYLTQNADLSTFAHEMSHADLTQLFNLAVVSDRTSRVVRDASILLKAFGLSSLEEFATLPATPEGMEKYRKIQEWWAYSTEIYLSKGSSPDPKAEGVLRRFGSWIRSVYRSYVGGAQSYLNLQFKNEFGEDMMKMSDEVRGVMERMYSAESAFDRQVEMSGLDGFFKRRPEGMSDQEWSDYLEAMDTARIDGVDKLQEASLAQMKWLSSARGKILKGIQKEWDTARKAAKEAAEEAVHSMKCMNLLDDLRDGGTKLESEETERQGHEAKKKLASDEKKLQAAKDRLSELEASKARGDGHFELRGGKLTRSYVLRFSELPSPDTLKKLLDKINAVAGDGYGLSRISDTKVLVANFKGGDENLPFGLSDKEFLQKMESIPEEDLGAMGITDTYPGWIDSEYGHDHDWSQDPEGKEILDLLGVKDDGNQAQGNDAGGGNGPHPRNAGIRRDKLDDWRAAYDQTVRDYVEAAKAEAASRAEAERAAAARSAEAGGLGLLHQGGLQPARELTFTERIARREFASRTPQKWIEELTGRDENPLDAVSGEKIALMEQLLRAQDMDDARAILSNAEKSGVSAETREWYQRMVLNPLERDKGMVEFVQPDHPLTPAEAKADAAYAACVRAGDTAGAQKLVDAKLREMGFDHAVPEQCGSYRLRLRPAPHRTIRVYKTFYVDKAGRPSALFVGGGDQIPMGVWLDALDCWHFTDPKNGRKYVPSFKNPNGQGGTTGDLHNFPPEVRQYLLDHGFITDKNKSGKVISLKYRPGWHAGDLPFFPQGGKQDKASNYGNVHRWNQVVFECEFDADEDFTSMAQSQAKARKKNGGLYAKEGDLEYIPDGGYYRYSTNPLIAGKEDKLGNWMISGSMKVVRAMTQQECDDLLTSHGMKPQEWEQGTLDLSRLGVTEGEQDESARKTVAPITYDEDGRVIPLSMRFNAKTPGVLYQRTRVRKPHPIRTEEQERAHQQETFIRPELARKDDSGRVKVVDLVDPSLPDFPEKQGLRKWLWERLKAIGEVTVKSTGQRVVFSHGKVKASFKKERIPGQMNAYKALKELLESAEYDYSKKKNKAHEDDKSTGGQDVYRAALRMNGKLYIVTIACDVFDEGVKKRNAAAGLDVDFVSYKDHETAEIEIAPNLLNRGSSEGNASGGPSQSLDAISRISLAIARGKSKPSELDGSTLKQAAEDAATLESSIIRGAYDPSKNRIYLTQNADLSTFAHEMSHADLTQLFNLAVVSDRTSRVVRDASILLKAFGLSSLEEFATLPATPEGMEKYRKIQEWWAYSTEIYLSKGSSPDPKAEGVLRRFGSWIRSVYRSYVGGAQSYLNLQFKNEFGEDMMKMSDEVRGVMERMYSAESAFDRQVEMSGLDGFFKRRPEGMSDQEWSDYLEAMDTARIDGVDKLQEASLAQMKWLSSARGKILKGIQKEWDTARKAAKEAAEEAVHSMKCMNLLDDLRDGGTKLESEETERQGLKFDRAWLETQKYTPEQIDKLRRLGLVTSEEKGGFPPDALANLVGDRYGITTGRELIDMLMTVPDDVGALVSQLTDQYMMQEHSEMQDPKWREARVIEALHTEARMRMVALELKFFSKASSGRVFMHAAKIAAHDILMRTKMSSISAKQYQLIAGRCASNAIKLLQQGDRQGAINAKHQQLLNMYMAREALEIDKNRDRLNKIRKRAFQTDKKLSGARDMNLVMATRAIFAAYSMAPDSIEDPLDCIAPIEKYAPED